MIQLARARYNNARNILTLLEGREFRVLVDQASHMDQVILANYIGIGDHEAVKAWYLSRRSLEVATWQEIIAEAQKYKILYYSRKTRGELIALIEKAKANERQSRIMEQALDQSRDQTTGSAEGEVNT